MNPPAFLSATRSRTHAAPAAALEQLLHPARYLAGSVPGANRVGCHANRLDAADSVLLQNPPRRLPHGTGEDGLTIVQQLRQFVPAGGAAAGFRGIARFD